MIHRTSVSTPEMSIPEKRSIRLSLNHLFICIIFVVPLAGCSWYERVAPIPPTFLEGVDTTVANKNLPFQHSWFLDTFKGKDYHKLAIKPVRTDLLTDWKASLSSVINSEEDYQKEARLVADHFREKILNELEQYPVHQFTIVELPDPAAVNIATPESAKPTEAPPVVKASKSKKKVEKQETTPTDPVVKTDNTDNTPDAEGVLVLEIALTELQFSHPIARIGAILAPVPGLGAALSGVSDPHVAFAARIYDPKGTLVGTVADRKFPPTRIVDLNKVTATSSVTEICDIWAKEIAETINKGREQKSDERGRFSLLPW